MTGQNRRTKEAILGLNAGRMVLLLLVVIILEFVWIQEQTRQINVLNIRMAEIRKDLEYANKEIAKVEKAKNF